MAVQSPRGFVTYVPVTRERRARRQRTAAIMVIAAVASSTFLLQAFNDGRGDQALGVTPAALTYFPN